MQSASVALMINPNLLGRHTAGKGERQKPSGLKSAYPDFRAASREKWVGILWLFQKAKLHLQRHGKIWFLFNARRMEYSYYSDGHTFRNHSFL